MTVKVTVGGLDQLIEAFAKADRDAVPEAKKVTGRGCLNIKKDWQARWTGLTALPGLPRTITYDVTAGRDWVRGEVGPDRRRGGQAALAHIPEYGMPQKNTPPRPGGRPAIEAEAPRFERALEALGEDLLR
jgi:hypothetical protein